MVDLHGLGDRDIFSFEDFSCTWVYSVLNIFQSDCRGYLHGVRRDGLGSDDHVELVDVYGFKILIVLLMEVKFKVL